MASPIIVDHLFASKTILAAGNATYNIDLSRMNAAGFFSLQIEVLAGSVGTLKFEYLLSNNNTNYVEPTGATDIVATFGVTSGPGADGIDIYSFEPEVCRWVQIKATEDGGADPVTFDAWLAVQ